MYGSLFNPAVYTKVSVLSYLHVIYTGAVLYSLDRFCIYNNLITDSCVSFKQNGIRA